MNYQVMKAPRPRIPDAEDYVASWSAGAPFRAHVNW